MDLMQHGWNAIRQNAERLTGKLGIDMPEGLKTASGTPQERQQIRVVAVAELLARINEQLPEVEQSDGES